MSSRLLAAAAPGTCLLPACAPPCLLHPASRQHAFSIGQLSPVPCCTSTAHKSSTQQSQPHGHALHKRKAPAGQQRPLPLHALRLGFRTLHYFLTHYNHTTSPTQPAACCSSRDSPAGVCMHIGPLFWQHCCARNRHLAAIRLAATATANHASTK